MYEFYHCVVIAETKSPLRSSTSWTLRGPRDPRRPRQPGTGLRKELKLTKGFWPWGTSSRLWEMAPPEDSSATGRASSHGCCKVKEIHNNILFVVAFSRPHSVVSCLLSIVSYIVVCSVYNKWSFCKYSRFLGRELHNLDDCVREPCRL